MEANYVRNSSAKPLLIPLKIEGLCLEGEIDGSAEGIECEAEGKVTIAPGGSHLARLSLDTKAAPVGKLAVTGLTWTLFSPSDESKHIRCHHVFRLRGRPLNNSRKNRASAARSIDHRLS